METPKLFVVLGGRVLDGERPGCPGQALFITFVFCQHARNVDFLKVFQPPLLAFPARLRFRWIFGRFSPPFGPFLAQFLTQFWTHSGLHFGPFSGPLRGPVLSANTRKTIRFGAFRHSKKAQFWAQFRAHFDPVLGPILGSPFGMLAEPHFP